MKRTAILAIVLAGVTILSSAQTTHKSAAARKKTAPVASPAVSTPVASPAVSAVQLPAGIPPVAATVQTAFALRYQDITIGSGALAEPNKLYRVHYTGWLASDGTKFDSSYDHPESPVVGKDGKPETGEDGKPKTAAGQPLTFAQGMRQMLPGFDQGFGGMHIGGKRRIFIPWQLAYGAQGRPSPDPKRPGIPALANLIFDVELVDVSEIPVRQQPTPPTPRSGSAFPFKNGMPPGVAPAAGATTPGSAPVGATAAPASATPATATPAGAAAATTPTAPAAAGSSTAAPAAAPAKPIAAEDPTKPTAAAPPAK